MKNALPSVCSRRRRTKSGVTSRPSRSATSASRRVLVEAGERQAVVAPLAPQVASRSRAGVAGRPRRGATCRRTSSVRRAAGGAARGAAAAASACRPSAGRRGRAAPARGCAARRAGRRPPRTAGSAACSSAGVARQPRRRRSGEVGQQAAEDLAVALGGCRELARRRCATSWRSASTNGWCGSSASSSARPYRTAGALGVHLLRELGTPGASCRRRRRRRAGRAASAPAAALAPSAAAGVARASSRPTNAPSMRCAVSGGSGGRLRAASVPTRRSARRRAAVARSGRAAAARRAARPATATAPRRARRAGRRAVCSNVSSASATLPWRACACISSAYPPSRNGSRATSVRGGALGGWQVAARRASRPAARRSPARVGASSSKVRRRDVDPVAVEIRQQRLGEHVERRPARPPAPLRGVASPSALLGACGLLADASGRRSARRAAAAA